MSAEKFVKSFYNEKETMLKVYCSTDSDSEVATLIKSLKLSDEQFLILKRILNNSFTDIFYTILLGLDGNASIGGIQETYNIKDEKGNQISGKIEEFAYQYFQE